MALKRRNKVNAAFSMSSMTDIVFLLLIFFMVTSTLVHPTALKLLMPGKKSTTTLNNKKITKVSISNRGSFSVNGSVVGRDQLEQALVDMVTQSDSEYITLETAKNVTTEQAVFVMDIAKRKGYQVVLKMQ